MFQGKRFFLFTIVLSVCMSDAYKQSHVLVTAYMWKSEGDFLESVLSSHKEIQGFNSGFKACTAVFLPAKPLATQIMSLN